MPKHKLRGKGLVLSVYILVAIVFLAFRSAQQSAAGNNSSYRAWKSSAPKEGGPEKAFVVASMKHENTSWLADGFPGWHKSIYVVDDPEAELTVATNKGRESMVYLSYIIDNYDNLPANMLFLHAGRYQWHNDDPDYDGARILRRFQLPHLQQRGYVNLRCVWTMGCPAEIRPAAGAAEQRLPGEAPHANHYYAQAFAELFPGKELPEVVAASCCAQFGVTREKVRSVEREAYEGVRQWLLRTPLDDSISGRILEYSWHILFGQEAVHCPNERECYCSVFGLCDLECADDGRHCRGMYMLPPYSTLPHGWPVSGWSGEQRTLGVPG